MATSDPPAPAPARLVLVWDLPVRLFHWAVVLLVAFSYVTAQLGELGWHMISGCTMLAMLVFRWIWGVVGSDTARFSRFLRSPVAGLRHLAAFRTRGADTEIGHNAAGGWVVIAMLLALSLQVATGLFADDDISTQGPLGQFVSRSTRLKLTGLHSRLFWALAALIAMHVTAIAAYRVIRRQDLIGPMVNGRKLLPGSAPAPAMGRLGVAAVIFAMAGVLAWRVWALGDGSGF